MSTLTLASKLREPLFHEWLLRTLHGKDVYTFKDLYGVHCRELKLRPAKSAFQQRTWDNIVHTLKRNGLPPLSTPLRILPSTFKAAVQERAEAEEERVRVFENALLKLCRTYGKAPTDEQMKRLRRELRAKP